VILAFGIFTYLSISSTDNQFRTCTILNKKDLAQEDFSKYDSVLVAASTLYEGDWIKDVMQGEQYRDAWAAPIRVPIVYLDTLKGGLTVIEEGGGQQTHSLEVEDTLGIRYSFRSITKDPSEIVPDVAKEIGLDNIIVDGVSAQHPYAALVVAHLAGAVEILHTHPQAVFVSKQKVLGDFNEKYGNRLYLFEFETEGKVNWTNYPKIIELFDTDDIQKLKADGEPITVDRSELIRVRLFDLLIGDWDRHAKQWGWAVEKKEDVLVAHPVPGDRDNAFFKQEEVIPSLISNDLLLPKMQTFEKDIEHMPGLVRPFDEYFLRNASMHDFVTEAEHLQHTLTDSVINRAFLLWPENIRGLDADEIETKLIARRKGIVEYAKLFKQILDDRPLKAIELEGSEDLELDETLSRCFDCVQKNKVSI